METAKADARKAWEGACFCFAFDGRVQHFCRPLRSIFILSRPAGARRSARLFHFSCRFCRCQRRRPMRTGAFARPRAGFDACSALKPVAHCIYKLRITNRSRGIKNAKHASKQQGGRNCLPCATQKSARGEHFPRAQRKTFAGVSGRKREAPHGIAPVGRGVQPSIWMVFFSGSFGASCFGTTRCRTPLS